MWKARMLVAAAALSLPGCHGVLFTAPPGCSVTLIANPEFISANGGVSLITVIVFEPAQTPVPDGTVILFFTNLGRIEEQVKTKDGIGRVNLVADGRSGEATVTALACGGAAPVPAPSGSPGTGGSTGSGSGTVTKTIVIGNLNAAQMLLLADPPKIGASRFTYVTATVFDLRGNTVQGAPVFFSVTTDPATESFDSGVAPVFTDNDGRATSILRTRRPFPNTSAGRVTANVQARVPSGSGTAASFVSASLAIPID